MIFDLAFFIYGLFSFFGFVGFLLYKPKQSKEKAKNVEFVIPTVANEKTLNSLFEVLDNLRKFKGYKIWVVVDEGNEIDLKGKASLVVVPNSYKGKKCKGRALEYFRENYVKENKWYVFLDDDSYPEDDSFLYEINYYEKKGYVAANGILKPREGKSKISFILDHVRYWDDLFIFKLTTGLFKSPIAGFHGELLIIKGSVLKKIPFPTNSLVEDFVFSQKIVKNKLKTWQSKTIVSIKSPNSIKDLWKQRARWIKGIMLELKNCNLLSFIFVLLRVVSGFFASMLFLPLWFIFPTKLTLAIFGYFGTFYYISSYFYGTLNSKDIRYSLLIPLLGIFEPISFLYIIKINHFVVIDKN